MVPLWNLRAPRRHGVSLGRVEHRPARGRAVVGAWRRRHEEVGGSRLRALGRAPTRAHVEPAPRDELHQRPAGAEVSLPIDRALRAGAESVTARRCAACHDPAARGPARSIPSAGDRDRPASARHVDAGVGHAYNKYGEGHSWKFSQFRKTDGYIAVPLDGLWLTGPYLHNGSVPSLADLLEPVEARPQDVLARLRPLRRRTRRLRDHGPGGRTRRHPPRYAAGQQQRRSPLRHGLPASEAGAARVPEDALGTELPRARPPCDTSSESRRGSYPL